MRLTEYCFFGMGVLGGDLIKSLDTLSWPVALLVLAAGVGDVLVSPLEGQRLLAARIVMIWSFNAWVRLGQSELPTFQSKAAR